MYSYKYRFVIFPERDDDSRRVTRHVSCAGYATEPLRSSKFSLDLSCSELAYHNSLRRFERIIKIIFTL